MNSDKQAKISFEDEDSAHRIRSAVEVAAKIISPVWPLETFIASNPLQGFQSLRFEDGVARAASFFSKWRKCHNPSKMDSHSFDQASDINRELIKWCHAFLDEGQATLKMPDREKGFYKAWAIMAPFDKKLVGKSSTGGELISSFPSTAEEALTFLLGYLKVPKGEWEDYLSQMVSELPGWAGYIKWKEESQREKKDCINPINLVDYLAVQLSIAVLLFGDRLKCYSKDSCEDDKSLKSICLDGLKNKEDEYINNLLDKLVEPANEIKERSRCQKAKAQLIFCIDVRSEPFRRQIEQQGPYETFGFAGFFGLPVCIHDYNNDKVSDSCPALVKPKHDVYEEPLGGDIKRISKHKRGKKRLELLRNFYGNLKYNFATPFALVETLGLWYGLWMAARTLVPAVSVKLKKRLAEKIMPPVATEPRIEIGSNRGGIPFREQVLYAESMLRVVGLTDNFSQALIICGHGSATENNPYASALDCGACGGNHGGPNAKILAAILNDLKVREGLRNKGIVIPKDTFCIAAEHNTTTDEVVIFDHKKINDTHEQLVEQIKKDLAKAGVHNSQKRCKDFGLVGIGNTGKNEVLKRSCDWSEVRPEWGLARNGSLIIAPRALTKEIDLEGRSFLQSYDWEQDENGMLLESIFNGPVVVAQWISSQYFFSTIDNRAYGSGSKITHNIAGKIGLMQGNGSDLMHGLPLQSVNSSDDKQHHDPMRLQIVVYAPVRLIESIIEKQPALKILFINDWASLIAIEPADNKSYRLFKG